MDEQKWKMFITKLTAGVNDGAMIDPTKAHFAMTVEFFNSLGIDDADKQLLDIGCYKCPLKNTKAIWNGVDINGVSDSGDIKSFINMDCHDLQIVDECFDIVFCNHTLEHVLAPLIVLSEIHRVLKNDGDVVIGLPIYPSFIGDDHNYVLTEGSWKHLFKRAGFKVVKETGVSVDGCACFHLRKV